MLFDSDTGVRLLGEGCGNTDDGFGLGDGNGHGGALAIGEMVGVELATNRDEVEARQFGGGVCSVYIHTAC